MKFQPYPYQEFTIKKIIEKPKIALFLDMGLGKTVCTLTALNDLIYDYFEVKKILIIAPLRVADYTWEEEISKWDHLKGLTLSKVIGSPVERMAALKRNTNIYIINRENTKWLVDLCIKQKRCPFDCLVVDESSSFKAPSSQRFKALRKVAKYMERVILLTGTPVPNGLIDLWSQIYLLDQGVRLEKTLTAYRNKYFYPGRFNGPVVYEWFLKKEAEEEIYRRLSDISVSLSAADYLKMPKRIDNVIDIGMPDSIKAIYKRLEREYVLDTPGNITALSAGVLANKLLQLANGCVYDDAGNEVWVHDLKLAALDEIVESNEGKSLLVFYNYRHDLSRLKERYKLLRPRELKTVEDKSDWDKGKIRMLLAHPASMGHGLNLQSGGHVIIWYGLNWSLELYEQANARLYRQGQQHSVIIHHLVLHGSIDEAVMKRLSKKGATQKALIDAIKARIKAIRKEVI